MNPDQTAPRSSCSPEQSDPGPFCLQCRLCRSNAYHQFLFKIFQNLFRLSFQKYQHSGKISHSNSMNPDQFKVFSGLIWIQTICTKIIATSK